MTYFHDPHSSIQYHLKLTKLGVSKPLVQVPNRKDSFPHIHSKRGVFQGSLTPSNSKQVKIK